MIISFLQIALTVISNQVLYITALIIWALSGEGGVARAVRLLPLYIGEEA